jgi:hypothetical protein
LASPSQITEDRIQRFGTNLAEAAPSTASAGRRSARTILAETLAKLNYSDLSKEGPAIFGSFAGFFESGQTG